MQKTVVVKTGLICFILFVCTLLFSGNSFLISSIYVAASVALLSLDPREWRLFALALVAGVVIEPLAVRGGLWSYSTGYFFGVPLWIFLVWGVVVVSGYRVGVYLHSSKS